MTHAAEPHVRRRSLVRTAAHAAWAVPAITVVTAAPAFADSTIDDLTEAVLGVERTADGGYVRAYVPTVTNDGPRDLPVGTVFLALFISGGATFDVRKTTRTQGFWQVWDANSSLMRFRYEAPVTVGTGIYLGEYLAGFTGTPATGHVEGVLTYNGSLVATQTITW